MTENPYAAPIEQSLTKPLSPAAIRMRAVSRAFRILGWTFLLMYLGPAVATLYQLLKGIWGWYQGAGFFAERVGAYKLVPVLVPLTILGILLLAWTYIRIGKQILKPKRHTRKVAVILSCLLLVLLPLGLLCLWYLYKHWNTYCAEQMKSVEQTHSTS